MTRGCGQSRKWRSRDLVARRSASPGGSCNKLRPIRRTAEQTTFFTSRPGRCGRRSFTRDFFSLLLLPLILVYFSHPPPTSSKRRTQRLPRRRRRQIAIQIDRLFLSPPQFILKLNFKRGAFVNPHPHFFLNSFFKIEFPAGRVRKSASALFFKKKTNFFVKIKFPAGRVRKFASALF